MPIHRTDLFAIIAIAWQGLVALLICGGIHGILYDILSRGFGIPWNSQLLMKFLLGIALLETPLLGFAVYWFRGVGRDR